MDAEQDCPLVVDLDGTLINTDLLVETAFEVMGRQPWTALNMVAWLAGGRARLKQELAARARLEVAHLPYNEMVLESVRAARSQGRRVILASASDERLVAAVADHLGLFDAWMGSDGTVNLAGGTKAARLQQMLDGGTFDYIGNSRRDLPVWRTGRRAILANAPDGIARQLGTMNIPFDRTLGYVAGCACCGRINGQRMFWFFWRCSRRTASRLRRWNRPCWPSLRFRFAHRRSMS